MLQGKASVVTNVWTLRTVANTAEHATKPVQMGRSARMGPALCPAHRDKQLVERLALTLNWTGFIVVHATRYARMEKSAQLVNAR